MEAGPRDVPSPDHRQGGAANPPERLAVDERDLDGRGDCDGRGGRDERTDPAEHAQSDGREDRDGSGTDAAEGSDAVDGSDAADDSDAAVDGSEAAADAAEGSDAPADPGEQAQSFRELRPQRLLRFWQLAPIVALGAVGSLMFAFPLAFEFGDGGAVVAMLGLLLCCCSAGWGIMAARRVGCTWPGLPVRGSGERPDWRFVILYVVITVVLAVLAVWRVARLR
jgi:hypothetical protein